MRTDRALEPLLPTPIVAHQIADALQHLVEELSAWNVCRNVRLGDRCDRCPPRILRAVVSCRLSRKVEPENVDQRHFKPDIEGFGFRV